MNVRELAGHRFTYEVESEEKPGAWYTVDIVGCNGAGSCTCTNWGVVRHPRIRKAEWDKAYRCKHVGAASEYFLWGNTNNGFLNQLSEQFEK